MKTLWTVSLAILLPAISFAEGEILAQGEQLKYAIKWGVVTGGYSSLEVENSEVIDGRPTYHVVAKAHSTGLVNTMYPVNDRNEAWIEPTSPSTLRYARNIREGKYRLEEQVSL